MLQIKGNQGRVIGIEGDKVDGGEGEHLESGSEGDQGETRRSCAKFVVTFLPLFDEGRVYKL